MPSGTILITVQKSPIYIFVKKSYEQAEFFVKKNKANIFLLFKFMVGF